MKKPGKLQVSLIACVFLLAVHGQSNAEEVPKRPTLNHVIASLEAIRQGIQKDIPYAELLRLCDRFSHMHSNYLLVLKAKPSGYRRHLVDSALPHEMVTKASRCWAYYREAIINKVPCTAPYCEPCGFHPTCMRWWFGGLKFTTMGFEIDKARIPHNLRSGDTYLNELKKLPNACKDVWSFPPKSDAAVQLYDRLLTLAHGEQKQFPGTPIIVTVTRKTFSKPNPRYNPEAELLDPVGPVIISSDIVLRVRDGTKELERRGIQLKKIWDLKNDYFLQVVECRVEDEIVYLTIRLFSQNLEK